MMMIVIRFIWLATSAFTHHTFPFLVSATNKKKKKADTQETFLSVDYHKRHPQTEAALDARTTSSVELSAIKTTFARSVRDPSWSEMENTLFLHYITVSLPNFVFHSRSFTFPVICCWKYNYQISQIDEMSSIPGVYFVVVFFFSFSDFFQQVLSDYIAFY